ncbi:MAG: 2-acylglycerophosphoethanolamine acyltransferase, partial [Pseudomonadota bacterium]
KRFAKIGGEMISLTAVEELAEQAYPGRETAVVSIADPKKGERLILCVTGDKLDLKAIRTLAKQKGKPELMVPKDQMLLDEMPVLGTGKTDQVTLNRLVEERMAS